MSAFGIRIAHLTEYIRSLAVDKVVCMSHLCNWADSISADCSARVAKKDDLPKPWA
jgi:hypothetical protein